MRFHRRHRRRNTLAVALGLVAVAVGLAVAARPSGVLRAAPSRDRPLATDMGGGILDFRAGRPLAGVQLPGAWWTLANGDDVLALAVEGDVLWAGTRAGGLVRWDRLEGSYIQFLRPQDPLASNTIRDIEIDSEGRKWLSTPEGLTVFDDAGTPARSDDRWYTFNMDNSFGGLPSNDVYASAIRGNEVWVGTHQVQDPQTRAWVGGGLARLDHKGTPGDADDVWAPIHTYDSTRRRLPNGADVLGLVSDNINALEFTPAGRLWVGTAPFRVFDAENAEWPSILGGLSVLDTKDTPALEDDVWTGFSCEDAPLVVSCFALSLSLDEDGWMWAGTRGRGVMFFQASGTFLGSDGDQRFTRADDLPDNDIAAVAHGPAGSDRVFVATEEGVGVIDHGGTLRNKSDDVVQVIGAADGLSRDHTQALTASGGDLWVGTGPRRGVGGGIHHVDAVTADVEQAFVTSSAHGGRAPTSNFIRDLAFGSAGSAWEGHVWVATGSTEQRLFGEGVFDLDTKGTNGFDDDTWASYTAASTDANGVVPWTGLSGDNVHSVLVDGDAVWFGSAQSMWSAANRRYADGGLSVFDGSRWTNRTALPDGLASNNVSSLARGCDGRLWVGFGSKWEAGLGVSVLTASAVHETGSDHWESVRYPQLASNQTSAVSVNCGTPATWVSASHHVRGGRWADGGAARHDPGANSWTSYDSTNGLTTYAVDGVKAEGTTVLAGPGGAAWVGSYGTADTSQAALIQTHPFWPAVINAWNGSSWSSQVFDGAGWVSSAALDHDGRLWVGLSRGGAARDSIDAENWREDRTVPGLMLKGLGDWQVLDTTSGLPSNDVSVIAVDDNGDVWLGTEGWGMSVYRPRGVPPTVTPVSGAPSPTPSATRTATARVTAPTATPSGTRPTSAVSATPTRTGTPVFREYVAYLPVCYQTERN